MYTDAQVRCGKWKHDENEHKDQYKNCIHNSFSHHKVLLVLNLLSSYIIYSIFSSDIEIKTRKTKIIEEKGFEMKAEEKEKGKNDLLPVWIFGILLSYLTYAYVLNELKGILADYNGHTYVYLPLFTRETWVQGWMAVPYCMWHLIVLFLNHVLFVPIEYAAAYTACAFTLFAYFMLYWMLQRVTKVAGSADSSARSAMISFGMCLVQPFYFSWLDAGGRFLGSYSMNPIHNPTYMCMRGFSLVCFCLICDIWGRQKDENYHGLFFRVETGLKKHYIYMALFLFLSAMAKPTFAEMFIPAVAFVMLGELFARLMKKDGSAALYFRHCLFTLLCAVPTLLYILVQFLAYFIFGGSYGEGGSLVLTKWFEVWSMYTRNVGLSMALGLLFPLFIILINVKYFLKSDMGRLALVSYFVGVLEAALLGESGEKIAHADFLWPMMSGMLMLFVTSMLRLLVLERTQADTKGRKLLVAAAWFIFCMHVMYGIIYVMER